jgi:hypothetical protein
MWVATTLHPDLVDAERIELSTLGCRPSVFPLAPRAQNENGAGGDSRNPTLRFTGPLLFHLSYAGKKKKASGFAGGLGCVRPGAARSHTSTPAARWRGRGWCRCGKLNHEGIIANPVCVLLPSLAQGDDRLSFLSQLPARALGLNRLLRLCRYHVRMSCIVGLHH